MNVLKLLRLRRPASKGGQKASFLAVQGSRALDQYFKIQLTYTPDALEGNRLTLAETKILLEDGISPAGRQMGD